MVADTIRGIVRYLGDHGKYCRVVSYDSPLISQVSYLYAPYAIPASTDRSGHEVELQVGGKLRVTSASCARGLAAGWAGTLTTHSTLWLQTV